jgi:alpha-beta hydrolase superfamily lysophospholipase
MGSTASIANAPIQPPQYEGSGVGSFQNKQGLRLFYRKWLLSNSELRKGRVFISHGFGQHSGMYEWVAAQLNQDGFDVFAIDHQGKFDHHMY